MFKKTLLALAMAGVAGAASAATITVTGGDITISSEGFAAQTAANQEIESGTDFTNVSISPASPWITNDVVEVTFAGATVNVDTGAGGTVPAVANGLTAGTATYLDVQGGNKIRFRVTADWAAAEAFVITGLTLVPTSSADGSKVTVSSTAISSSSAIGSYDAGAAKTVATFDTQLSVAVDQKFDATIDVGTSRTKFTGGLTADTLELAFTNNTTHVDALAFAGDVITHTLKASDLSFLNFDTNKDGEVTTAEIKARITFALAGANADTVVVDSVDLDTGTIVIKQTVDTEIDDVDVTITAPGSVTVPEQDFTASIKATDTLTSTTLTLVADGTSVGSWANNGTTFHVPVMAFDANHATSVRANNRSSLDADVELVLYVNGTAVNAGKIGTLAGRSSMDFASAIKAKAEEQGVTLVGFDLVFEGTASAIDISAQYVNKKSGSRAVVQTNEL